MIGILDYGMGNLRSVLKAIEFLGGSAGVYTEQSALDGCDKLILPGVGSFGAGMENLRRGGLDEYVRRRAADGTPVLGICLGMQFLLEESEEEGVFTGLGLVKGRVVPFTEGKIPHMGWNAVDDMRGPLFVGSPRERSFISCTAILRIRRTSSRSARRSITARSPRRLERTTCSAYSSTPKRAGRRACSSCAIL